MKGLPIVISAPSGSGKSTIAKKLVGETSRMIMSISCTTRAPRPGEEDGKHYFFISENEFKKKIKEGAFLEWAEVHGHYYGTPLSYLKDKMADGVDVILAIDVQGALSIKRFYPHGIFIFLVPPSWDDLKKRLEGRAANNQSEIKIRLTNARKELSYLSHYNYLVLNDDLDRAVDDVRAIIRAEHCRLDHVDQSQIQILK